MHAAPARRKCASCARHVTHCDGTALATRRTRTSAFSLRVPRCLVVRTICRSSLCVSVFPRLSPCCACSSLGASLWQHLAALWCGTSILDVSLRGTTSTTTRFSTALFPRLNWYVLQLDGHDLFEVFLCLRMVFLQRLAHLRCASPMRRLWLLVVTGLCCLGIPPRRPLWGRENAVPISSGSLGRVPSQTRETDNEHLSVIVS